MRVHRENLSLQLVDAQELIKAPKRDTERFTVSDLDSKVSIHPLRELIHHEIEWVIRGG